MKADSNVARKLSAIAADFYQLGEDEVYGDITSAVLESSDIDGHLKDEIRIFERKFVVFQYPTCGGVMAKALISYQEPAQKKDLVLFLRGGNRDFGIPMPAFPLNCFADYVVITALSLGGVNPGQDEFGGEDVEDIKNLVDFIPRLNGLLGTEFEFEHKYAFGAGRGGFQLFLSLSRFPELQAHFDKAVSLSGFYDLRRVATDRPDMEVMFRRDFGLTDENQEEWFAMRDAVAEAQKIRPDLPLLIIHGSADIRHSVGEAKDMVIALLQNKNTVSY